MTAGVCSFGTIALGAAGFGCPEVYSPFFLLRPPSPNESGYSLGDEGHVDWSKSTNDQDNLLRTGSRSGSFVF